MSAHAVGCVFDVSVMLDRPNTGGTDLHRAPGRHMVLTLQILRWSVLGHDKGNLAFKEEGEEIKFSQ
jgi:hypothetical protein